MANGESGLLDAEKIKHDFPIFSAKRDKPLVYLDSAATSQKPAQVIDAVSEYYRTYNANIHRGMYEIAELATERYIGSKQKACKLINADSIEELVYTKNTTEAINLVALSWGASNIAKGDHILISQMEHHSNIIPWQMLAKKRGAILDYIKLDDSKSVLDEQSLEEQLEKDPKVVAITHVSNVLGTVNDVKSITIEAHKHGSVVLIDGAQSAPRMKLDMRAIDADFFAFSGHKMLGPAGIGILYAKRHLLESMEPLFGGGDMIKSVTFDWHEWNDLPWKFEAGTPNVEGAIGLGAAIDYLNNIGIEKISRHEAALTKYALEQLSSISSVTAYGLSSEHLANKTGVISFSVDGIHPHDVAQIFDYNGIAIRAGHHCAMPLVTEVLGINAVSRMSFYLYNSTADIDKAVEAIKQVKSKFKIAE